MSGTALITGISGQAWADAAVRAAEALGIGLTAHVIGPGRELTDLYDDWARLREVDESGCVLVRPDAHVAWRSQEMVEDPEAALLAALRGVLDRGPTAKDGSSASRTSVAV